MSRRREATELARVLLLSTQEARFALITSPHTLSSPGDTGKRSNTDDSREMEIRPMVPGGVDPRLLMRPPGSSANQGGTASSSQSQSGSGEGGRSTIEQVQSTAQRTGVSTIQPFTPSAAPTNPVLVPESSEIEPPNPHQPPAAQLASSVPSSARAPPVGSTEQDDSADASGPLFSPTQGSRRNLLSDGPQPSDIPPAVEASPARPLVRHQYSRAAPATASAMTTPVVPPTVGSSPRPFQLSSSPDIPTRPQLAVKPARKSRAMPPDSDNEDGVPVRAKTPLSPRSMMEQAGGAVPATSNTDRSGRRESPDPLLLGPSRPASKAASRQPSTASIATNDTPTNARKAAGKAKAKPRLSSAAKGKGKEREKEKWADNEKEVGEEEPPKRISSRVKDLQAKEEAEKLERRRKRAEEKERLAKEAAAKMAAIRPLGGPTEIIEIEDDEDEEMRPAVEVRPEVERVETQPERAEPLLEVVVSQPERVGTPESEVAAKAVPRKSTVRKRVLSSSPAPSETIIAIIPGPSAAAPLTPSTSAAESAAPAARAPSTEHALLDTSSEAGPSKPSSAKRPPAKKTVTQSKKAAAAAAKKEKAAIAKKEKEKAAPAPKTAFKSREMVESDEDDDMGEDGDRVGPSSRAAEKEDGDAAPPVRESPEAASSKVPSPAKATPAAPVDKRPPPARRGSPSPSPARSPPKATTSRSPLTALPSRMANVASSSTPRHSPGPMSEKGTPLRPDGIKFKTERNDLASVLSKFPTSRFAGMSRRLKIAPLHSKIGPPKKELPPPPKKAEKRKKGDSDEDEDEDEEEEDEEGVMRKKGKKERGMEWYMVED